MCRSSVLLVRQRTSHPRREVSQLLSMTGGGHAGILQQQRQGGLRHSVALDLEGESFELRAIFAQHVAMVP